MSVVPAPTSAQIQRKPRTTAEQRRTFLDALEQAYSVTHAAKLAGLHRRTFYKVRERDDRFAQAWDEAFELGTEMLEDELRRRALQGWEEDTFDGEGKLIRRVHRFSSGDLLTMLKARRPDLYRDNARIEVANNVTTRTEVAATVRHEHGLTMVDVLAFARGVGPDVHRGVLAGLIGMLERRGELTTEALEELNSWCRQAEHEPDPPVPALPQAEVAG